MYGLEAITAANGWAMALFGIMIVLTGLWVLSTIIAQFPKGVAWLEKRGEERQQQKEQIKSEAEIETIKPASPQHNLSDIQQTASLYDPLVAQLGESFELKDLYQACKENDFPHPHLTIRTLIEAEILVPAGDGRYGWNK